jgi:putative ABC transport system ATP-binding protein
MQMTLFKLEKVTKSYQFGRTEFSALKNISLSIMPGEFIILSGPSCSGKTTLLNLLGAAIRPTSGRVSFKGNDISFFTDDKLAALRRSALGFIAKAGNLLPALTLAENVELAVRLADPGGRAAPPEQVMALLTETGLAGLANKRADDLDPVQLQRGALARALAKRPDLILVDEPTAYLNPDNSQELLKMFQQFKQSRRTAFVISTTDPLVMAYGQRVVRLYDGRIEADELC